MSSEHEHQVDQITPESEEFRSFPDASVEEHAGPNQEFSEPEVSSAPIPLWLVGLIGVGVFWAGAYLFSFSGGFRADVFDHEPKFGVQGGGPRVPPDPKVVGKALFSANCITCHQASGEG